MDNTANKILFAFIYLHKPFFLLARNWAVFNKYLFLQIYLCLLPTRILKFKTKLLFWLVVFAILNTTLKILSSERVLVRTSAGFERCTTCTNTAGYQGHYLLLINYSTEN